MKKTVVAFAFILLFCSSTFQPSFKIAKLKYQGGGDWYANKTSLPNLIAFCNRNVGINLAPEEGVVEAGSVDLFQYPLVHMTGHGNVVFSNAEVQNLRNYLIGGGFLHIDDNYGMDKFIRPELKKIFPESDLVELPFTHDIYHQKYHFNNGLPKIHEHDGKTPKGYGILYKGRLVVFYSFECDLGNGWEDKQVYNDSDEVRSKALQMGANIVCYALTTY